MDENFARNYKMNAAGINWIRFLLLNSSLGSALAYDGEDHHGELTERAERWFAEEFPHWPGGVLRAAPVAATLVCGWYPAWLERKLNPEQREELEGAKGSLGEELWGLHYGGIQA